MVKIAKVDEKTCYPGLETPIVRRGIKGIPSRCPPPSPKIFQKEGTCRPHPPKHVSSFDIKSFFVRLFLLFLFLQVNRERHYDVGVPNPQCQTGNPTKSSGPDGASLWKTKKFGNTL